MMIKFTALMLLSLLSAPAMAGTPWGGEDTGTIPADAPSGPVARCENGVAKGVGKLAKAIMKCHIGRATGKLADATAEEACETSAKTRFEGTNISGCAGCMDLTTLADTIESVIDTRNDKIYCAASGTPVPFDSGGEDTGTIPKDTPKGPLTKCEDRVAKGLGKYLAALMKCHSGRVTGKLANESDEDTCESTAAAKFGAIKTLGCNSCTSLGFIAGNFEGQFDGSNDLIYCGSPSGAFLGGTTSSR
jgi:hypothetical protein